MDDHQSEQQTSSADDAVFLTLSTRQLTFVLLSLFVWLGAGIHILTPVFGLETWVALFGTAWVPIAATALVLN